MLGYSKILIFKPIKITTENYLTVYTQISLPTYKSIQKIQ